MLAVIFIITNYTNCLVQIDFNGAYFPKVNILT